jgi:hypothetical protein
LTSATPIYRAIMLECERQRIALGYPMEKFSEFAGLPERYYSKALHVDEKSGRQAQWGTLQIIIDALFDNGFDLTITPKAGAVMTAQSLKAKLLRLQATANPKSQRTLMSELGARGGRKSGEARRRKAQLRTRRREAAKAAARIRWKKRKVHD